MRFSRKSIPLVLKGMVFILLGSYAVADADRDLQYVLERYVEVMGGNASLENVLSVYMTGTITFPDQRTVPISILKKRPGKLRTVEKYQNLRVVTAYNGKVVWRSIISDFDTKSEILTGKAANGFKLSAPLENSLMRPASTEATLELASEKTVVRTPCFCVQAHFPDGSMREFLIEKETLLDRRIYDYDVEGNLLMENIPSDFQDFNGVLFAMEQIKIVDGKVASTLKIDKVEINLGILDRLFDPPDDLVEQD